MAPSDHMLESPHMGPLLAVCLLAALEATEPLTVSAQRERGAIEVSFELTSDLPESFVAALPTGAQVRVVYAVRVRGARKLWWDRRLWRGEVTSAVTFDPVIGRYLCELVLDSAIVASQEVDTPEEAQEWLKAPPAVRLILPEVKNLEKLRVRVRVVFASHTKWLILPEVDGTDWIQVPVGTKP
ncbi:MAG: DUF4390 domain-containing protein [bacterium]|nr:DUF4390 domain-containing protein [bacterium]